LFTSGQLSATGPQDQLPHIDSHKID